MLYLDKKWQLSYTNRKEMEKKKQGKKGKKTMEATQVREVMDIRSLADYLGMGKSKIYALIRHKKIPASRIGRQYRFSKAVIDQWLKEKLITHGQESQMTLFEPQSKPPSNEP